MILKKKTSCQGCRKRLGRLTSGPTIFYYKQWAKMVHISMWPKALMGQINIALYLYLKLAHGNILSKKVTFYPKK